MKVLLFGYYGFQNAGDEAILEAIIGQLRSSSYNIDITALSYNARATASKHNIKAVSRNDFRQLVKAIKESDVVISGGGSILQDVTSSRSLMYYLTIIYIAKKMKKKVMFYGNGFGPINRTINKKLAAYIINKVDVITVRDFQSKELMKAIGIHKNIVVTADVTFSLEAENASVDIKSMLKPSNGEKIIGISVRSWKDYKQYKEIVAQIGNYLTSSLNCKVVFIPMQYPDDLKVSNEIAAMMKIKPIVLQEIYSPKEILSVIGEVQLLVGMRLHSLIFAAISGVPMVGLEYDPKINSFLKIIGQESGGNVERLDFIHLCTMIDKVLNNKDTYINKLKDSKESLRQKSYMNISLLEELFKGE